MPEPASQGSQHQRRASRIGLRTLRQRPRLVGETSDGDPIFEVRDVKLVLRPDGAHFHRLVACAKCGRDVAGAPVLGPADLERPPNSVICKECVRGAGVTSVRPAEMRRPDPVPTPPVAAPTKAGEGDSGSNEAEDGRLALLEVRLEDAVARLAELSDTQRSESEDRRQGDDSMHARLNQALMSYMSDVRAEFAASLASTVGAARDELGAQLAALAARAGPDAAVDARMADVDAALTQTRFELASLDERLSGTAITLTQIVEEQRRALEASGPRLPDGAPGGLDDLRAAVAENRRSIERLAASQDGLAGEHAGLRAQLAELAAMLAARPAAEDVDRAIDSRLRDAQATVDTLRADGLAEARAELGSMEERLTDTAAILTNMVDEQRRDLKSALDDLGSPNAVDHAVAEVAEIRRQVEARLDALVQQSLEAEAKIRALASTLEGTVGRLQEVDQGTQATLARLAADLDALQSRVAASLGRVSGAEGPDLLDALEQQLQEAESRMARRSDIPGDPASD